MTSSLGDAMGRRAATRLAEAPRHPLGHLPTPFEPADRLSEELGGPRIWLKRDDCTGLATGGNKTRKLEFLLGDAIAKGADTVVTFGAIQSNHARQTAAACARAGLRCELLLRRAVPREDPSYERSGNRLLDDLLGARVHEVADLAEAEDRFGELEAEAAVEGRTLYRVPTGGSSPVGALGYVAATHEWLAQAAELEVDLRRIVVASSSGGTVAGTIVGLAMAEADVTVDAACVSDPVAVTVGEVDPLVEAVSSRLGVGPVATAEVRRSFDDSILGDGYGIPTPEALEAIELLARTEGVLLDPVYTSKAFALLVARIRRGELADEPDVAFLHTGGAAGLFAYVPAFGP